MSQRPTYSLYIRLWRGRHVKSRLHKKLCRIGISEATAETYYFCRFVNVFLDVLSEAASTKEQSGPTTFRLARPWHPLIVPLKPILRCALQCGVGSLASIVQDAYERCAKNKKSPIHGYLTQDQLWRRRTAILPAWCEVDSTPSGMRRIG